MVQYWETTDASDNCAIGANDEPFFMPLLRTDLLGLRLQIPYHLITLNGGGLPIGAGVEMKLVNETGVTTLCDYGNGSTGKFKLGYINDGTNRIAEYQILTGIGFADENFNQPAAYSFDVVANDVVELDIDGVIYSFVYGIDDIPYPLTEWVAGSIGFVSAADVFSITLTINGAPGPAFDALVNLPTCAHEDYNCFRVKIFVTMPVSGNNLTFYSKPFRIMRCDDPTLWIQGTYPLRTIDCAGQEHIASGDAMFKNRLYMRIPASIEDTPSEVSAEYNTRSYNYKSSRIKKKLLKSIPVPVWFADAFETVALSQEFRVDGVEYYKNDVQSFFENNNEIIGTTYQNIVLPLQSSKCEKVFVC